MMNGNVYSFSLTPIKVALYELLRRRLILANEFFVFN